MEQQWDSQLSKSQLPGAKANGNARYCLITVLPYEVIVGADFLRKWKIKLDPIAKNFVIDEKALKMMLV